MRGIRENYTLECDTSINKDDKWTELQEECYERNCICAGCQYLEYNKNCKVKKTIISKIVNYGLNKHIKTKTFLED